MKYCKYGKSYIDGIRITEAMLRQIGKEYKSQDLSEADVEAIKALPLYKRAVERKEHYEEMETKRRKYEAEAKAEAYRYKEQCKIDLVKYLPILKQLSSEMGIELVALHAVRHPEGAFTDADINIEKLCYYAGREVLRLLAEKVLDCYITVTGGFCNTSEQFYCADEMRDIYGIRNNG